MTTGNQWQAEIYRGRFWGWWIHYTKGLMGFREDTWVFGSRERAEAVARRRLARLNRKDQRLDRENQRLADRFTIN